MFFCDAGDGNDIVTDEFEGEELMGWLIPEIDADEFEDLFLQNTEITEEWNEWFCWALWEYDRELTIRFAWY